jgi:hypothetical protein
VGGQSNGLEAFYELERFLAGSAGAHLRLSEIERESGRRGCGVARPALQAHLDAMGTGDVGDARVVEGPNGPFRLARKRLHALTLTNLFGEVKLVRTGYRARGYASVPPRCRAQAVEVLPQLRVPAPAREGRSVQAVRRSGGAHGGDGRRRRAQRCTEQAVVDAAADSEGSYATRSAAPLGPEEVLVGAIDCKGIPMVRPAGAERVLRRAKGMKANKKKMAIVAAVFSRAPRVRTPAAVRRGPLRRGTHPSRLRTS